MASFDRSSGESSSQNANIVIVSQLEARLVSENENGSTKVSVGRSAFVTLNTKGQGPNVFILVPALAVKF